ncbi:MAG: DUF1579 family protein [Saprospiraceae bacterium]
MTQIIFRNSIFFGLLLFFSYSAQSQVACDSDAAQQLDFLIGDWELFSKDGNMIGQNKVKLVFGTCTLEEDFKGADGLKTHSTFSYDVKNKRWTQAWSDDFGNKLNFKGTFKNDKLTLKANSTNANGKKVYQRIIYKKQANGGVSQVWQKSANNKEWKTTYSGTYKRKKAVL